MAGLTVEIQRNQARGDKKVKGFTGAVRSLENFVLEIGDEFTIPEKFDVYEQNLGNAKVQYIMVELTNGNAKPFYPSTFTKSRSVFNEDGTPTGVRKHTMGTAADEFRKHRNVQEAMESLRGKTLKVSDIEIVRTLRFGTRELVYAQIPTIDIVEWL